MNVKLEDTRVYQEAVEEGMRSLVFRLLNRLFGEIAEELLAKIQVLSLEQLGALGEALLELRLRSQIWKDCYKQG